MGFLARDDYMGMILVGNATEIMLRIRIHEQGMTIWFANQGKSLDLSAAQLAELQDMLWDTDKAHLAIRGTDADR